MSKKKCLIISAFVILGISVLFLLKQPDMRFSSLHTFIAKENIVNYQSDKDFQAAINEMLSATHENVGTIVSLYSHSIEEGEWCVSPKRLVYIFERANELGLIFYVYKDLQQ